MRHQTWHCNGIFEQACICKVKGCCALAVPCGPNNGQPTCRTPADGNTEEGQRRIERRLSSQSVDLQRLTCITLESATNHALTAFACHSAPSPYSLVRWTDQVNNHSPKPQPKTQPLIQAQQPRTCSAHGPCVDHCACTLLLLQDAPALSQQPLF